MKKSKIKTLGIIAAILIVAFIGYTKFFKKSAATTTYQTAKVERGTLVSTVSASGQVSTANNTPVVTQVTGVITKLYVKNGDKVLAGAPIASITLDQSSQQKYSQQLASYQSSQNSLVSAKNQKNSLKNSMITADQNFLKQALNKSLDEDNPTYIQLKALKSAADSQYNNQDNVIAQSEQSLNSSALSLRQFSPTIYAPISGTISSISLQVGSVIPAQAVSSSSQTLSQNVAVITTSSYPIVSVNLTEIDIPKVKLNDKATITFDAFPNLTFTGKVFSIYTTGQVSSGVTSYPTTLTMDTENANIYANMSATASIIVDSKDNVLFVPTSAVVTQNGQSALRILKDGALQYVPVETGLTSDTSTEIVSGINEGDEIVTAVVTTASKSTTTSPFGIRTGGFGGAGGR